MTDRQDILVQKWRVVNFSINQDNKKSGEYTQVMRVPGGMVLNKLVWSETATVQSSVFVPCSLLDFESFISGVKFE